MFPDLANQYVSTRVPIVILGAGPAGAGAAYKLARRAVFEVNVIERSARVGGNAGSFELEGMRVDYGSHRLHPSCSPAVMADIRRLLGEDLLERPRHGRIRLHGRWVRFPLRPLDLLMNVPLRFTVGVAVDSISKPWRSAGVDQSFATVLEAGLGPTICHEFYFPYAEKIWGLAAGELAAEQARRRVSAGSIGKMVRKMMGLIPGLRAPSAGLFYYPRMGFGSIAEAYSEAAVHAGACLRLNTNAGRMRRTDGSWRVAVEGEDVEARLVLSTIPITALARAVEHAPERVLESARALKYRAMILIYLVIETSRFSEFDAHYFPEREIAITRLSEPKNYSLQGAAGTTVLCAELPCSQAERYWTATDGELAEVVRDALKASGLELPPCIRRVEVRRLPQAYPIYTRDYQRHLDTLDEWLSELDGLVSFGRQGLFAHDNTHHALAMAYAVEECTGDDGRFDRERWAGYRREFERHVVED